MTFNGLADSALAAIKLHRALDLERSRVCGVPGDTNKDKPLLVGGNTIIDDLSASKSCVTVENLGWRRSGIRN